MILTASATLPYSKDHIVQFTSQAGPNLNEPKQHGEERNSNPKRGLMRAVIDGLTKLESLRASSNRIPVTVGIEDQRLIEELRSRESAGNQSEQDHDLWSKYLRLRSGFELKFVTRGGEFLSSR
jgi:hypothetical protein